MTTRIGIFVFDGAEELDWAGPFEVLRAWQLECGGDAEVFTVSPDGREVTCAKGLRVVPDHSWASAPPIDVLVYPGGEGNRAHLGDERYLAWLRGLHEAGAIVTSVCTGSLVLAAAGLLDGRPATSHWAYTDELARLGERVDVRTDQRWVDDGDIVTAAGVSAGIDAALHLIVRLAGAEQARVVKRYIQYDPAPPV